MTDKELCDGIVNEELRKPLTKQTVPSESPGSACDHIYGYLVFMDHELSLVDALTDINPDTDEVTWFRFCPKCGRKITMPNRSIDGKSPSMP